MTSKWLTSLISGVAFISVTFASALPASAEQAPDKNGPGVARVSVVEGSAVVQRGDSHTQTPAVRNAPLLPGDYISTGQTSRAELQFDGSTAVRLGGNVQARITNNDPNHRQLQLADGTVEIGVVHESQPFQVDTPSVSVRAGQAGDYRVSIGRDGSSWVTVRRGHVDVITPQRTYGLDKGRTLVARGSASNPSITYASAISYDSFDDFNAKRDETMMAAFNASPNLNPSIAGYDNLDSYGQWQGVAGYGQVWIPQQSSNWAPYRNGSWVWEGGYGWTWVGSEPWGWAPYHYGRWIYADGYGWGWYPPAYNYTPAWSPALVGFFGFGVGFGGAGWGVSAGFGGGGYGCDGYNGYGGGYGYGDGSGCYPNLGWVPLAPYEAYYPWYPGWAWTGFGWGSGWYGGCCGGFYGGTRVVNITNIYNVYRNFGHGGGSGTRFGNFRHGTIYGHTMAVTSRNLGGHVGSFRGALPIRPGSQNLGFRNGSLRAPVAFSRAFQSGRFASNRSVAARTSFAQEQRSVGQAIARNGDKNRPVTRNNATEARMDRTHDAPVTRNNATEARMDRTHGAPVTRNDATQARMDRMRNAPATATSETEARMDRSRNAPATRTSGTEARLDRTQSVPVTRSNATEARFNDATRQENAPAIPQSATGARERAPSDPWQRFNQARGTEARSSSLSTRSERPGGALNERPNSGASERVNSVGNERSAGAGNGNAIRDARGPSDSWGRFSQQHSDYAAPAASNERGAYSRYQRDPYEASSRNEARPSYSYGQGPSYSRGSYNQAPSYSRGSYNQAPSYSRGSYGQAPSYSRGPSGGQGPSQGRGSYSPPHQSTGGGDGGGSRRGGGRPPQ